MEHRGYYSTSLLVWSLITILCIYVPNLIANHIITISHICHFLYTDRIFKFQILHLKIPQIYPQKSQICSFLRSIWKNLHLTEIFTRAAPVVPVTNMRYEAQWLLVDSHKCPLDDLMIISTLVVKTKIENDMSPLLLLITFFCYYWYNTVSTSILLLLFSGLLLVADSSGRGLFSTEQKTRFRGFSPSLWRRLSPEVFHQCYAQV